MKTFISTFLATCCFLWLPLFLRAQTITDDWMQEMHQQAAKEIEAQLQEQDSLEQAEEGWDDHYRTSDLEGERGTGYNRYAGEPDGVRVGCMCMDGTRSDERGRGACNGYGGVRYWIYLVGEDSTVLYPTSRHWEHPDPLSEQELANLSSRTTGQVYGKSRGKGGPISTNELLAIVAMSATVAYVAKLLFGARPREF